MKKDIVETGAGYTRLSWLSGYTLLLELGSANDRINMRLYAILVERPCAWAGRILA